MDVVFYAIKSVNDSAYFHGFGNDDIVQIGFKFGQDYRFASFCCPDEMIEEFVVWHILVPKGLCMCSTVDLSPCGSDNCESFLFLYENGDW